MTSTALAYSLCFISAITVAAAGFFAKRGGDVLVARSVLSIGMALTVLPFAFFVPLPRLEHLHLFALASSVHWAYQMAMISALHRGDLSLVFPVMRGLGPLMAGLFAIFVLNETFSPAGWIGLLLASGAVILFARPTKTGEDGRQTDRLALVFSGLTAIGIGAYTVTDAFVVRNLPAPETFIVWLFLLDWIGVAFVAVIRRRGRLISSYRPVLKDGMLGGIVGAISYSAALYSFTLIDAALVAALRETSVIFAAIMGAVWLKEGFGPRRIIAAAIMASGLIMMQVFG
ncbi:MAG: DMT family transporter [Pseudomonadota bacterium]